MFYYKATKYSSDQKTAAPVIGSQTQCTFCESKIFAINWARVDAIPKPCGCGNLDTRIGFWRVYNMCACVCNVMPRHFGHSFGRILGMYTIFGLVNYKGFRVRGAFWSDGRFIVGSLTIWLSSCLWVLKTNSRSARWGSACALFLGNNIE